MTADRDSPELPSLHVRGERSWWRRRLGNSEQPAKFRAPSLILEGFATVQSLRDRRRLLSQLLPEFDRCFPALLEDLSDRGLLASTLAVGIAAGSRDPRRTTFLRGTQADPNKINKDQQ